MIDATELALAIVNSTTENLTNAIQEFEQKMCARAREAAEESARNLELFISPDNSAEKVADLFKTMMATVGAMKAEN